MTQKDEDVGNLPFFVIKKRDVIDSCQYLYQDIPEYFG